MNRRSLVLAVSVAVLAAGVVLVLTREDPDSTAAATIGAAPPRLPGGEPAAETGAGSGALPAPPLEAHRKELLELAFKTASAIPAMPHVKTRSRVQEEVVVACLQLGQPRYAHEFIEKIDNWRSGAGYADLAFWCARNGAESEVQRYLELARQYVEAMNLQAKAEEEGFDGDDGSVEGYQPWRRDRIRAKIARTYLWLGREEEAIEFEDGLEASESGAVEVVRARTMPAKEVDQAAALLDSIGADGSLEQIRNALDVGLQLLERFHGDDGRRALFQQRLTTCVEKTPVVVQVDYLISIAARALEWSDAAWALQLAERAEQALARTPPAIEDELPLRARLAGLRHRAGQREKAREGVDAALATFQATRDRIDDLSRANVLVPIAETYAALGDPSAALVIYRRAAEDGAENPNAVPRAEDLVNLCCSMARSGIEPDSELWLRMYEASADLREPW
jgi:hypothetical protein